MPGPLDAFPRIPVGGQIAPPPVADPTFGQLAGAHYNMGNYDGVNGTSRRIYDGYKPIIDALNIGGNENPALYSEPGDFRPLADTYHGSNPTFAMPSPFDPTRERTRSEQEQRIADLIAQRRARDPNFLPGVPADVDALREMILKQDEQRRAAAQATMARGHGVTGLAAGLLGGTGSSFEDQNVLMTMAFGGVGRTFIRRVLMQGATFAAVTAAEQPNVASNRAQLGESYTAGDFAGNVGGAFVGGALLHGLGEGAKLGGGYAMRLAFPDFMRARDANAFGQAMDRGVQMGSFSEQELPSVAARLMSPSFGVDSQSAALGQLRTELAAGTIDDRALAAHFRLAVPEDLRTPDENAALALADRNSDIAEANPYQFTPGGVAAHDLNMSTALHSVAADRLAAVPGFTIPRGTSAPAAMTPDETIRFVQSTLEGGAKVVHYGEGDGGTTKYGIAQKDNPGVDVANLSAAGAADIAKRKYWLPEFDRSAPGVAPIAFDAYYLHGDKNFALKLARMDDPGQALAAYRDMLKRIAETRPGKAQYLHGWMNRLDKLGRRIGTEDAAFGAPVVRRAFDPGEPGVQVLDRDNLALEAADEAEPAPAPPSEGEPTPAPEPAPADAAETIRAAVAQALADDRAVFLQDAAGEHRIVGATQAGLLDDKGVTVPHDAILSPDAPPARVLIGPEPETPVAVRARTAPVYNGPEDVRRVLAKAGGVADNEGHDLLGGRDLQAFVPGHGAFIRRNGGISVDEAGELLWEKGFFGPQATTPRPTESQVLDLIERAAREKVYRPEDALGVAAAQADAMRMPADEALFQLAGHAQENGLHLDPQTLDDALGHLSRGETLEGAVAHAVEGARFRDAGPSAGLERFDDPDGAAFDAALDSLEHDARMDAAGEGEDAERLRAMLDSLDREQAGADAIRSCMAPAPMIGAAE